MAVIDFELGKKAIVQIYYSDSNAIAGTGFWVGGRYLMTCAHVVDKALNLPDDRPIKGQSVQLVFAEAGLSQKLPAEVIYCRYDVQLGRKDVAVLQLAEEVPLKIANIWLATLPGLSSGAEVKTYGYANGDALGSDISAVTKGSSSSWVQVEVIDQGLSIQDGMSGSPVWCEDTFVGMVVAKDTRFPLAQRGFIVPATSLIEPCRFVEQRQLLDILDPYEQRLSEQLMAAYQLCRNSYAVGRSHSSLANILKDLADKGAGAEDSPNKLVQFVACLLNRLEQPKFSALVIALTAWASDMTDDLDAVRNAMRTAALKRQSQEITPVNPVLLVSVSPKSLDGTPTFSVQSWLLLNPKRYDPLTGRGAELLSLKGYGDAATAAKLAELTEEFEYIELPLLLAAYINQICLRGFVCSEGIDLSELTVELFLPFSLMNQPFERLGLSQLGFVEPLGISDPDCPQVLLRSQDRLDQSMAYARWEKKWSQIDSYQQEATTKLLVSNRKTLKRDLKDERALGVKLNTSPIATNRGEIARLVISGAPMAVWVRDHPSAELLFQRLEQDVLAHPLKEFPDRILSLRRETQELEDESDYVISDELGHHLSVLWENPKHVPPSYRYSASKL